MVVNFIMNQPNFPAAHGVHAATGIVGTQVVWRPKVVREFMDEGVDLEDSNGYDVCLIYDS